MEKLENMPQLRFQIVGFAGPAAFARGRVRAAQQDWRRGSGRNQMMVFFFISERLFKTKRA